MVERIARVLSRGARDWRPWEDEARAVLAAMREPTHRMIKASKPALKIYIDALPDNLRKRRKLAYGGYHVDWAEKMTARWQVMIDAAITSSPTS